MKEKSKLFILMVLVIHNSLFSQETSLKLVQLHNGEISLKVPHSWEIKENVMRYAVYEIKYNVELRSVRGGKVSVILSMYDTLYGPKMQITDSIVASRKEGLYSHTALNTHFLDSGIKIIEKIKVGYLKYTYLQKKG